MNWNANEIKVTLGNTGTFSVYPKYGCPMTRLVQNLATAVGGMLWLTFESGDSRITLPVPNPASRTMAGSGTSEGLARYAANAIENAVDNGSKVFASSTTGTPVELTFEFVETAPDEDAASETVQSAGGAFRRNF